MIGDQRQLPGGPQQQQPQQPPGPQPLPGQPQPQPGQAQPAQGQNPLQPQYAPNPVQSNVNLDPQAAINQILQGFAPQAASANRNFMDTMALSGLSGGPVQSGEQQLQGQLAAGLAPSLAGAYQNAQGNELAQSQGNQNAWNQQGMFNAGEGTSAGSQLAQMLYGGWGQQLGALGNIIGTGQQGAGNIAGNQANNFGIQQPIDWGQLAMMFGSGGGG